MSGVVNNLVISLALMQIGNRIPFADPQVLMYVRIAYVLVQAFTLGVYYYIGNKIKHKNDLTTLKFVEPRATLKQEPGEFITTNNRDYDLEQVSNNVRGILTGVAIMCVMHFYFHFTQPLFMQSVLPLKTLYESKIVRIHLLGYEATGDLKRPFAAPKSPFANLAGDGAAEQRKTNAVATAAATAVEAKKDI